MARQAAEVRRLTRAARAGDDPEWVCLHWLGALRQAERYLSALRTPAGAEAGSDRHRATLQDEADEARSALADADPAVLLRARRLLGIRVAVIGKGGTGKSMIVGTLARLLARLGRPVLAVDFDTNPGLAYSLGVPGTAGALPEEAVMEHPGAAYGWGLRDGVLAADVVEHHALVGPDGVRFVSLGKIGNVDKDAPKRTVSALQELVAAFGEPHWDVIGDMEAGPTTPFEGYHSFADRALVVITPSWVSAMTARRLLPLVDDVDTGVIANQFRDEPDHPEMAPIVRIPTDPSVADAERQGLAPLDQCPDSPAVAAIRRLTEILVEQEVTV
jgi:CO dehydrogenase maturation factor